MMNLGQDKKKSKTWLRKIGLIPSYSETSLFLMSWALLLFFIFDNLFKKELVEFFFKDPDPRIIFLLIFLIVGFILSIYYAFSKKQISRRSKYPILFYAIFFNFFSGYSAGVHVLIHTLKEGKSLLIIFPIINIISAILLLMMLKEKIITISDISDKQAKLSELLIGSLAIFIVFFITYFVFDYHWAISFSICMVYVMNFNNMLSRWIKRIVLSSSLCQNLYQ